MILSGFYFSYYLWSECHLSLGSTSQQDWSVWMAFYWFWRLYLFMNGKGVLRIWSRSLWKMYSISNRLREKLLRFKSKVQQVALMSKEAEECTTFSFKKWLRPGTDTSKALYRTCPTMLEGLYPLVNKHKARGNSTAKWSAQRCSSKWCSTKKEKVSNPGTKEF